MKDYNNIENLFKQLIRNLETPKENDLLVLRHMNYDLFIVDLHKRL